METTSVHVCLQICKYRLGLHFYMRCHIKHWSEVIVPYSLAGQSPIVEATGETIVVYALYLTSQLRWSHHWAVTLSRWPCLLYSSTSVGRGLKKKPWHCSKRVGDVGPDVMVYLTCAVIGLGGRGVIKNTDWSWSGCKSAPLHADVRSHLSGSSAIQPLASSEESWHRIYFL